MKISFSELEEETVYDNHGCPAATDYLLNFTVDGVEFTARYRNHPFGFIDLWSDMEYVGQFYNSGYHDIKFFVEELFGDPTSVASRTLLKIKGGNIAELEQNLLKDMLAANFCD